MSHAVDDNNCSAFPMQSDNLRDQALSLMMGGVLELKKEDVLRMVSRMNLTGMHKLNYQKEDKGRAK